LEQHAVAVRLIAPALDCFEMAERYRLPQCLVGGLTPDAELFGDGVLSDDCDAAAVEAAFGADYYARPQSQQRHVGIGCELLEPAEFLVGELGGVSLARLAAPCHDRTSARLRSCWPALRDGLLLVLRALRAATVSLLGPCAGRWFQANHGRLVEHPAVFRPEMQAPPSLPGGRRSRFRAPGKTLPVPHHAHLRSE